jgi:hypothetical protein
MAAELTRLTHKIAIQLHLVAKSCNICSSRSRRPVRKFLDTPSWSISTSHSMLLHLGSLDSRKLNQRMNESVNQSVDVILVRMLLKSMLDVSNAAHTVFIGYDRSSEHSIETQKKSHAIRRSF